MRRHQRAGHADRHDVAWFSPRFLGQELGQASRIPLDDPALARRQRRAGRALLNTIAISATARFVGPRAAALVHGFSVATGWGTAILLIGALAAALLITAPAPSRGRSR